MPNPLYEYADPNHPLLTPPGTETGAGLGGEAGPGNAYDALMGYVRRVMATDPVAVQKALQDQAAAERQRSVDMGLADPTTGLPTAQAQEVTEDL